jgi:hypothetical protein
VHGQREYAGLALAGENRTGGSRPVHLRHRQIHDDNVGLQPIGRVHRITAVARFADYVDVPRSGQDRPEAGADDGVVIRQQHSNQIARHDPSWIEPFNSP